MNEDIDFLDEEEDSENADGIEFVDDAKEDKEEDNTEEETPEEETKETAQDEDSEIDIDIDALFEGLDDVKDAVEKVESTSDNPNEMNAVKETLANMEKIIKRLSNEKADLTYKLAEVEAFGSDNTDPKILLLSRNLAKANSGDDKAKTKTVSILKDMLYNLTGEDMDLNKVTKDVDLMKAMEDYNSTNKPNINNKKSDNQDTTLEI